MFNFRLLTFFTTLSLTLVGCATATAPSASLVYESKPAGATIYENGISLGVAPVMKEYNFVENATTLDTPEVTAVWASGAKVSYWTKIKPRDSLVATLVRPVGAEGLAKDLEVEKDIAISESSENDRKKNEMRRSLANASAQVSNK